MTSLQTNTNLEWNENKYKVVYAVVGIIDF